MTLDVSLMKLTFASLHAFGFLISIYSINNIESLHSFGDRNWLCFKKQRSI